MGRRYETVSLLTDYGLDDEFVGVVKSVIRDLAPHVTVVDLTHGVRPFDVRGGSLALARAIPYVPDGVVVAVVDPGVGTSRKAIAVEVADGAGVLVGPDNGLLAPAVALAGGATRAVELDNAGYHLEAPGATFAGRDVFAPAAAHLCNGVDLDDLGSSLDSALLVPGMIALPRTEADGIHAEVLWVDRFGNCQLNVGPDELAAARRRGPGRRGHRHLWRRATQRSAGRHVRRPGDGHGRSRAGQSGHVRPGPRSPLSGRRTGPWTR